MEKQNTIKKSFFDITIVLLLCLINSACEEQLQEDIYSDYKVKEFYTNPETAQIGLWGVYDALGSNTLYGQAYLLYFHTGTDEDRYYRQSRGGDDDSLGNYDNLIEDNGWVAQVWTSFYDGINRANIVIDQVNGLKNNTAITTDILTYERVIAEAKFLRAFMYFQLVKNWGAVPLKLTNVKDVNDLQIGRTPAAKVYEQIEEDLLDAIAILPQASDVLTTANINKGAAKAILARVYLNWAGKPVDDKSKFEKAIVQLKEVIESGQHSLNTNIEPLQIGEPFNHHFPEVYKNYATDVYDLRESMWEIHFSMNVESNGDDGRIGSWFGVHQHSNSGYGQGSPRRIALPTFLNSFEADDTFRKNWSVSQFEIDKNGNFIAIPANKNKLGIGKFRRYLSDPKYSSNVHKTPMNWPIIRYADVLLMYAESINETILNGGILPDGVSLNNAYNAINQVRRRARMVNIDQTSIYDLSGTGGIEFRTQIRDERKWELCFENQRKPDLIRWGILIETVKETGVKMVEANFTKETDYLPAYRIQERNVLLPIPYNIEIRENPMILDYDKTNNGYR